jgi:hypothetical protein
MGFVSSYPHSIGSDGIAARTMVSQTPQLSFGRVCSITLKLAQV